MNKTFKELAILVAVNICLTFLILFPFYLRIPQFLGLNFSEGPAAIYRNFDGLEYIVIAKSWYSPQAISNFPLSLPANYYAAHFPGYALLMLPFAPVFGFLKSMIFVAFIFTILSSIAFYFLVRDFKLTNHPLLLSIIFLILPARWLVVHSVGSAEPMFIFFTIASLYFFLKYESSNKFSFILATGVLGMLAQLSRPPGILLFFALGAYLIWKIIKNKSDLVKTNEGNILSRTISTVVAYSPLFLIPVTLLMIFYWYSIAYQDFFAYFHSGDNIHLTFPPYQVFNINQPWVGSIWLEDIIYLLILGFLGGIRLFKQKLYPLAFYVLVYLGASTLVAHRDLSRYTLPIFPFVLIAFEKVLVSQEFKIVLAIVALAIYLYAQNFLTQNTAPIFNLEIFN
ncbi:MAG: glycosyltransferase family 39 protein [Alphaproteobacteria bacterium]